MKIGKVLRDIGISSIHIGEDKAKLCELIIKQYAYKVAKQALKDASENADLIDCGVAHHVSFIIDRDSILNTEIITP